jgi:actin-like ATPase involved in cell morphogenesis
MEKNLRKIVSDEIAKVISEDYDYAAAEREYVDKQDYEAFEAQVSSALSFMQDIQGSSQKVKGQLGLSGTNPEVDNHLSEALKHINEAIQSYFKTVSPEVKTEVVERLGEVNIDK